MSIDRRGRPAKRSRQPNQVGAPQRSVPNNEFESILASNGEIAPHRGVSRAALRARRLPSLTSSTNAALTFFLS